MWVSQPPRFDDRKLAKLGKQGREKHEKKMETRQKEEKRLRFIYLVVCAISYGIYFVPFYPENY